MNETDIPTATGSLSTIRLARRIARLALAATLSIVLFAASIVVLHFLRPEYDPRQRFMSEFAVGPYGYLMTLAFFALSLGAFALALGFQNEMRLTGRRWHGPLLFSLCGADLFIVGIFPSDLQGVPTRTLVGIIHDWASTPPFLMIMLAMPLIVRHFQHEVHWRTFRYPTIALGIAALLVRTVTLVPFGIPWCGLTQRILATLLLGWLLLAAFYLRTYALRSLQS